MKQSLSFASSHPPSFVSKVNELCGGDMEDLSSLELLKRDDLQFQVVDETDYDEEGDEIEIVDELSELFVDDEDDDDEENFL